MSGRETGTSFKPDIGNSAGEFKPTKPGAVPLETSGHQPGQQVGNDAAPEFNAQTLPPGTAPKESTFKPNPINEIPGQANNPDVEGSDAPGSTGALDMPGATSADVHTGYGHPGQGQTTSEIRNEGQHHNKREGLGTVGQAEGGSGLHGDESVEAKRLQRDHAGGNLNEREHNASLKGAEDREPVQAEQVASMGQQERKQDYDRGAAKPPGPNA